MQSLEERADEMLRAAGGSMAVWSQRNALRRMILAENKVTELEAALREIDTAANWVGRRNAWNRSLQRVGQPPTADDACREVRLIVRRALED